MATNNRRYYYLKVKENFYQNEAIMILESMPDGIIYSNLLMKMYLMSLKHNGILMMTDTLPHTSQTIATVTRHQVGTVERAIQIFMNLGFVEVLNSGAYYMTDLQLHIGQSSSEGERKRKQRKDLLSKNLLPNNTNSTQKIEVGQMSDKCPPILEYRDKSIDIRDKRLECESVPPTPNFFLGQYNNVSLTTEEVATLEAELLQDYPTYLERLSEYMASTGKAYNSHFATIRKWYREDKAKKEGQKPRNYDCKEGESL